jgi:hypothetical protein
MKMNRIRHLLCCALPALLALSLAREAFGGTNTTAVEFPAAVQFELGAAEFLPGDSITIESVRGTSSTIRTGETYCVEGTYTLASKEKANLALYATTTTRVATPTDSSQIMRIEKGSGRFRLVKTMREEGYLHISFYPVPSGSSCGGVYFGQGNWVLRQKGWSDLKQQGGLVDRIGAAASEGEPATLAGPNRALLRYLGAPVEPPADLDAAYGKAGLIKAVETAAQNAGISVRRVVIENSEFPFLVGVVCKEGDTAKLTEQFRKMPGYAYNGSTSTSTHSVFNLVPYRVFPSGTSERISHRTGLRCQVFLGKLLAQE